MWQLAFTAALTYVKLVRYVDNMCSTSIYIYIYILLCAYYYYAFWTKTDENVQFFSEI